MQSAAKRKNWWRIVLASALVLTAPGLFSCASAFASSIASFTGKTRAEVFGTTTTERLEFGVATPENTPSYYDARWEVASDSSVAPRGTAALERANPRGIRFTQDTVSPNFSDGGTITDALTAIRQGRLSVDDFPAIRVVEHEGKLWCLDNRRLALFKSAQAEDVPILRLSLDDPAIQAEFARKFRPIEGGRKVIVVPKAGRTDARSLLREFGKYSTD